jgi:hypothetical protein
VSRPVDYTGRIWKYARSGRRAKDELADLIAYYGEDIIPRVSELITAVDEFERRYYGFITGEDLLLGYAVFAGDPANIKVKAFIARGLTDAWAETIDIEEWLRENPETT